MKEIPLQADVYSPDEHKQGDFRRNGTERKRIWYLTAHMEGAQLDMIG